MNKVEVNIIAVATQINHTSRSHTVVLQQVGGENIMQFNVSHDIANALIMALEGTPTTRPFTHQLLLNTLLVSNLIIEEVVIERYSEEDEAFIASIAVTNNGNINYIDSRPSDALTLAVLDRKKIYVEEVTFYKHGISSQHENIDYDHSNKKDKYAGFSDSFLNTHLKDALDKEDYTTAVELRDELKRRKIITKK